MGGRHKNADFFGLPGNKKKRGFRPNPALMNNLLTNLPLPTENYFFVMSSSVVYIHYFKEVYTVYHC